MGPGPVGDLATTTGMSIPEEDDDPRTTVNLLSLYSVGSLQREKEDEDEVDEVDEVEDMCFLLFLLFFFLSLLFFFLSLLFFPFFFFLPLDLEDLLWSFEAAAAAEAVAGGAEGEVVVSAVRDFEGLDEDSPFPPAGTAAVPSPFPLDPGFSLDPFRDDDVFFRFPIRNHGTTTPRLSRVNCL